MSTPQSKELTVDDFSNLIQNAMKCVNCDIKLSNSIMFCKKCISDFNLLKELKKHLTPGTDGFAKDLAFDLLLLKPLSYAANEVVDFESGSIFNDQNVDLLNKIPSLRKRLPEYETLMKCEPQKEEVRKLINSDVTFKIEEVQVPDSPGEFEQYGSILKDGKRVKSGRLRTFTKSETGEEYTTCDCNYKDGLLHGKISTYEFVSVCDEKFKSRILVSQREYENGVMKTSNTLDITKSQISVRVYENKNLITEHLYQAAVGMLAVLYDVQSSIKSGLLKLIKEIKFVNDMITTIQYDENGNISTEIATNMNGTLKSKIEHTYVNGKKSLLTTTKYF